MFAKVYTTAIHGVAAIPVEVEVRTSDLGQEAKFVIVGLGDSAIREAKERVTAAIKMSGFKLPLKVIVNLAPAEVRKEGSSFDLAIAIGVLLASGQVQCSTEPPPMFGELALSGEVKPTRGIITGLIGILEMGRDLAIVPAANEMEASLISDIKTIPVSNLKAAIYFLTTGEIEAVTVPLVKNIQQKAVQNKLFAEVIGQERAKRALVIAASGAHNMLMVGPPGCGKSMLVDRLPSIFPQLTKKEMLEVVSIHSIAGQKLFHILEGNKPIRTPHYTTSEAAIVGGGTIPKPGEVSLAHHGVLFLDEFPEFKRGALESLRAPLESKTVTISRARSSETFPANFQLIAAMNPCPCGRLGMRTQKCTCSQMSIQNYLKKLSQPILDRIDIQVELVEVPLQSLSKERSQEEIIKQTEQAKNLIQRARDLQYKRQNKLNSELNGKDFSQYLMATSTALSFMQTESIKHGLSARGYFRMLRVSRTVADMCDKIYVEPGHIAEAFSMRALNRIAQYIGGQGESTVG